ncbi:MAG: VTC domain-containing protein, partial [Bacteroidales bacterium]|nr:VTC domain-containing protein [Bacteroidales bacterium]
MTSIRHILDIYAPIGLEEIVSVRFMNRVDTKYLFPVSKLPELLENAVDSYHILEIEGRREFNYTTVYFDTPSLLFFNQHVTGRLTRHKVRLRTYDTNGLTFLEVKEKSNKGRTSKTRIRSDEDDPQDDEQSRNFLQELIAADPASLKPVI